MNLFTVNQVNQVYVASGTVSTSTNPPANLGDVYCGITDDKKSIYFIHKGKGGITRTDLIDVDKIMYYGVTKAADMKVTLKETVLRLSTNALDTNSKVLAGYDYRLRIKLNHYVGISPEDSTYLKYGMVHTGPNMVENDFWKAMAKSILRNMSREATKLVTVHKVTGSVGSTATVGSEITLANVDSLTGATGIAIREVEPDWLLGLKQQKIMDVQVTPIPIEVEGEPLYWVNGQSEDTPVKPVASSVNIVNSKLAADYEYFFHGERGDQYRYVGWPDYIPTSYMVNPDNAYGYDFFQIHFSYIGPNEGAQKSEKDLTFLLPKTSASDAAGGSTLKSFVDDAVNTQGQAAADAAIAAQIADENSALNAAYEPKDNG